MARRLDQAHVALMLIAVFFYTGASKV